MRLKVLNNEYQAYKKLSGAFGATNQLTYTEWVENSLLNCRAKLAESTDTSTNKPSAEIAAAERLCKVYFDIAAECVGEDELRQRVAAATSHVG
jgi:hypothetical protein